MALDKNAQPAIEIESIETQSTRLNDQVSNNSCDRSIAADKDPAQVVFENLKSDIDAVKKQKNRKYTVPDWSDTDYKRLVKAIRTHKRDTNEIMQEMKHKPTSQIKRFSKVMIKLLGVSPRHPDRDILPTLKHLRNDPVESVINGIKEKIKEKTTDQKHILEKPSDARTTFSNT